MQTCEEIETFLRAVENARHDPGVTSASRIRDLPEHLQSGLAKAIQAVVEARYERGVLRQAAELVPSAGDYPGALGDAIQALTRVLIDNNGFSVG